MKRIVKIVIVVVVALFVVGAGFAAWRLAGDAVAAEREGDGKWYTCGMHPWIVLPEPGLCPICHMDLTPIDPDKFSGEIVIDPVTVQNIGVRVAPVAVGPLQREIRTVGTVTYDEQRVRDVNIKLTGWIEKVYVGYEGAQVGEGDPLFELYSPELYAAQQDYLLALHSNSQRLVEASRTKLSFYDVTDEQIAALEQAGKPAKTMTVRSPHAGIVIDKHANEGMNVNPGMRVYRIADLSRVWVMATLYEYQLPYVEEGQSVVMTLPYIPGQTFEGRVTYVYPYLNERTREVKVRLEFDNPHGTLKPGMFVNIQLQSTMRREATLVPSEAVINTGQRTVAFVSLGDGKFEPRDVTIGVETEDGKLEILEGIKPGEMVVISGQFLIDSESRFREALVKMIRGDLASQQQAVVAVQGVSQLAILPDDVAASLGEVLRAYFVIQDRLAEDSLDGISPAAENLREAMNRAANVAIPDHEHFWHQHDEVATVIGQAQDLSQSSEIAAARETFGRMSVALRQLLAATGIPPQYPDEVHALRCPMFRVDQGGAYWLQTAGDVRNPYMGQRMIECYDARSAMPVTGATP